MSRPAASATEVLSSIAQELEHAGQLCDRLETLVTQLVRATRGEPLAIALHEAQTLDVLTQHLAALATFTRQLSTQSDKVGYDLQNAVSGVTLGDLAGRLSKTSDGAPSWAGTDAGDLDLF